MKTYARLLSEFLNTPWAIMPSYMSIMNSVMQQAVDGEKFTAEEVRGAIESQQVRYNAASTGYGNQAGGIAVIPIMGVINQRVSMMEEVSGGVSADRIAQQIKAAAADTSVGAIVLNIDSPGGSVYGIQELADTIRNVRGQKKVVAIANSLAASAAYWIATAAEEFVITPGGEAGSIGVLTAHVDVSKAEEMLGIKTTMISAGKYKVEGNPYEPLSAEAQDFIQSRVNEYYDAFIKNVAKNRSVALDDVRKGFGQGRVLGAKEAVAQGMADGVETLDAVIARLSTKRGQKPRQANANRLALAELS